MKVTILQPVNTMQCVWLLDARLLCLLPQQKGAERWCETCECVSYHSQFLTTKMQITAYGPQLHCCKVQWQSARWSKSYLKSGQWQLITQSIQYYSPTKIHAASQLGSRKVKNMDRGKIPTQTPSIGCQLVYTECLSGTHNITWKMLSKEISTG